MTYYPETSAPTRLTKQLEAYTKNNDPGLESEIYEHYVPGLKKMTRNLHRKFRPNSRVEDKEDFFQTGSIGFIKHLRKITDPQQGYPIEKFYHQVRCSIIDGMRKESGVSYDTLILLGEFHKSERNFPPGIQPTEKEFIAEVEEKRVQYHISPEHTREVYLLYVNKSTQPRSLYGGEKKDTSRYAKLIHTLEDPRSTDPSEISVDQDNEKQFLESLKHLPFRVQTYFFRHYMRGINKKKIAEADGNHHTLPGLQIAKHLPLVQERFRRIREGTYQRCE